MVALPMCGSPKSSEPTGGCGASCGAGLEKIYPTTAVRYGAMNWIGEFSYKSGAAFKCGAKVVIQTDRGIELGQQVSLSCNGCSKQVTREQIKRYIDTSGPEFYRLNSGRILREAAPQDLNEHNHLNANNKQDIDTCALLAAQMNLDLKVVTAEHLLGGERIVFYFRSEDRVDFRDLVRELARRYQTRIEMRQVGARDEARLVADYEICGRECCCKNFLKKLRPVNMKMAKLQKSTLDPSKVSGRCGRLRCCLRYEHEGYEALDKKLPRLGARVRVDAGPGTVIDRQILTQLLMLRLDGDGRELAVPLEEVREFNLPKLDPSALPPPAEVPPARGERRADTRRGDGGRGEPRRSDQRRGREWPAREAPAPRESPGSGAAPPEPADTSAPPDQADQSDTPPAAGPSSERGGERRRRRRRRRGRGGPAGGGAAGPPGPPA